MTKPDDLFDRDDEWGALQRFVAAPRPGASLGLVYGRRRQGKTYLMQALTEATRGFYIAALEQSSRQNLDWIAEAYRQHTGSRARVAFDGWRDALESILALGDGASEPMVVVLDEFPYLLDGAPELPSILQDLLSPRGDAARSWRTRLLLCGSALTTMRGLLAGSSALRGRAELEMVVHPFDFRQASQFWGVHHEPDLAMRLHALVGGTPAYRDMSGGLRPRSSESFDEWVGDALLNPASAMFREGATVLSEESGIADLVPYLSVLSAVSAGKTRRGEIAATIGRAADALSHPLSVLTEARLISPVPDALKNKRTTYRIAEPIIRLNSLVVRPHEARLVRHHGAEVWRQVADTVSSNIYGPHFEDLARQWCGDFAASTTMGGSPSRVGPTMVACAQHRHSHEVDVVAIEHQAPQGDRVIALGEAKWRSKPCGIDQLIRLEHIRDVVRVPDARLLLFSRAGFSPDLVTRARSRTDIELVDLDRLYHGG